MAQMTIGQVAQKAGIRPSALRYYESVGLLPKPGRVGGQRRYEPEVLHWLAGIRLSQQAGFTVSEIRQLFYGVSHSAKPSEHWERLARKKLPEIEELIRQATLMKKLLLEGIRCGCASLQECTLYGKKRAKRASGASDRGQST